MASDPSGGTYRGLDLGRLLAKLPQSGSIEPARHLIDAARGAVVEHDLAPPRSGGVVSQSFAGELPTVTAVHVIAQVERVLDAEVSMQNKAAVAAAAQPVTTKGKSMSAPLIEIKGLGNAISGVRSGIKDVKALAGTLQETAGKLKAELNDVNEQIEDARSQIKDEAASMGNSSSGSGS